MNSNSYTSKQKSEITYFVYSRQKTFLGTTEIYLPNKPYEKLEDGYELSDALPKSSGSETNNTTSEEDKIERTKRRAYNAIKDYALNNVFELFVTFTFKEDRQNPELCRKKLKGWLKRARKADKDFQYVVVPELHKDGESLHFHALIKGYSGDLVRAINPNTGRALTKRHKPVFDFPNYTLGHSEVYKIGDTEEDRIRSGFYLLKYVKKDMPEFKNKKRYWASRGLDKPTVIENPFEWYVGVIPDHAIQTEYGTFLYFDNKRIQEYL